MRLNWGTAPVNSFQLFLACLTLLALAIALMQPRLARALFERMEARLRSLAQRRFLPAMVLFLLPIALRLALLPVYSSPAPFISDEYAYLLQSDTFASGRLTNPTPPLADRFTSVYILTRPTYTAEYQPGQGLILAAGQALTGVPWVGVLVSMGVLCAAIYWALLAWLPRVWAFTGTLVVVDCGIGVLSYWMNSYWGGCVPALGGTLTLGALPRISGKHPGPYALLAGLGLLTLFNTRPLEAVFLSIIVAGWLIWRGFIRKDLAVKILAARVVPALAVCAVAVAGLAAFYNSRVTGHATEFPYLLYREKYGLPQGFFWQKPVLANASAMPADIRSEYEDQLRQHERRRSLKALIGATGGKLRRFWEFYIGIPLTLPLVFLPLIWRRCGMGIVFWTLALVLGIDNLLFFAYFPHYSAAVTVFIVLVIIQCLRQMRCSGQAGLYLSRALPAVCVIALLVPLIGRWLQPLLPSRVDKLWASEFAHDIERETFAPKLAQEPGPQLVLVKYGPWNGQRKFEWIFNRADLAAAKVIWARYSGDSTSNQELLQQFPGRKLWLAEPDAVPPRVTPYYLPSEHKPLQ